MRELTATERTFVSGGVLPVTPLHPITVKENGGDSGPGAPLPSGGTDPTRGGSGGHPGGATPGSLSATQISGLEQIKKELDVDLTTFAQMSPTLAQSIASVTTTFGWHFAYSDAGGHIAYAGTSEVGGTIYISSRAKGNIDDVVQQLSHELGHAGHRVYDVATLTTSDKYVNDYLKGEGWAVLSNERIQHEIKAAGGDDIRIASSNRDVTRPLYDGAYNQLVSGQITQDQFLNSIANTYGTYEKIYDGRTYRQYYLDGYHNAGGKN